LGYKLNQCLLLKARSAQRFRFANAVQTWSVFWHWDTWQAPQTGPAQLFQCNY
jgi:hypothetical protein